MGKSRGVAVLFASWTSCPLVGGVDSIFKVFFLSFLPKIPCKVKMATIGSQIYKKKIRTKTQTFGCTFLQFIVTSWHRDK